MHCSRISICEAVPKFNEGKGYEGIKTIFEFENIRSHAKKCRDHREKVRQIIYTNQGHLPTKITPVIDFTDEPVIQCDVAVEENTFVDG